MKVSEINIRDKVRIKYGKFIDLPTNLFGVSFGESAQIHINHGAIGECGVISSSNGEVNEITVKFKLSDSIDLRISFPRHKLNELEKVTSLEILD